MGIISLAGLKTIQGIIEDCKGEQSSINVGSSRRRDALIAFWNEFWMRRAISMKHNLIIVETPHACDFCGKEIQGGDEAFRSQEEYIIVCLQCHDEAEEQGTCDDFLQEGMSCTG